MKHSGQHPNHMKTPAIQIGTTVYPINGIARFAYIINDDQVEVTIRHFSEVDPIHLKGTDAKSFLKQAADKIDFNLSPRDISTILGTPYPPPIPRVVSG